MGATDPGPWRSGGPFCLREDVAALSEKRGSSPTVRPHTRGSASSQDQLPHQRICIRRTRKHSQHIAPKAGWDWASVTDCHRRHAGRASSFEILIRVANEQRFLRLQAPGAEDPEQPFWVGFV